MEILKTVSPVLIMIFLGMFCRYMKWLDRTGIDNIKFLVTKIMLPTAIFHALATATYDATTIGLVGIMFAMLVISFFIGFALKRLVPQPYGKYVPFMVSVYEGGMMAYPLYTNLCGMENLSRIAILDIAGLLFGFSIYMGMLEQVENRGGIDAKALCMSALKNPTFIATVIGIAAGITGVIPLLVESTAGGTYLAVKDIITMPLSTLILLIVGYELKPDVSMIRPCIRTVLLRVLLQAVMLICVLTAVHRFIGLNHLLDVAVICYMSAPATFSMQSFIKDERAGNYAATANSLYCVVTITVYIVMALL